jgi:mannosyltransferase
VIAFQKFLAASFAAGIVCISNHTRHDLRRYYGYKVYQKSKTIYNGKADDFRQHEDIKRNAKSLVYVGSRAEYKNFDLVVRLGTVLKDYSLTIVGGKNLSSAENDGLERAWEGRWQYSGIVSNEELSMLYNKSAVLLYPSSEEGFGIPIIEAFSCGCAVVISSTPACIEISGGQALVTSLNIVSFARQVVISSELDKQNRANLTKYAEQFSWRSTATKIEVFITEKELS